MPSDSAQGNMKWTGDSIVHLTLHRHAPIATRLDLLPFIFVYIGCAAAVYYYEFSRFTSNALLATVILLHVLIFLMQHWLISAKVLISWKSVTTFEAFDVESGAIYALAYPQKHRGKAELLQLCTDEVGGIYFIFQKRTYEYNEKSKVFEKVFYPNQHPVQYYATYARKTGGISEDEFLREFGRYGSNKLDMPAPSFMELYKESLLSPFFVFQVFCILLWMLDEYWKYSLMTFGMMLLFQATVVFGRLRSLRELRGMRNAAIGMSVYRGKRWETVSSLQLVPGDIVSIGRGKDGSKVVPCDVLLLSGSAVVNEAMLTGESVPLMKEGINTMSPSEMDKELAMNGVHKNHILFGGTRVLTHTSAIISDLTPSAKAPDGGCVCFVLRTGFGSSQGKLMRTILYSTESVTENSWEAAMFILFLLIFAIAASGYVLYHLYTDEHDGRYKLLLRCVLIITSVVPPELPMQLALAVNNSLISLAKNMVFCTEPFRIPFAGKIDICCFDKTGTLTTDSINAAGVALPRQPIISENGADEGAGVEGETKRSEVYEVVGVEKSSMDAALVLGACHSLAHVENELVGDPLELAALESVQWAYGRSGASVPKRGGSSLACAKILHRYRFASALQRMSVIAEVSGGAVRNGIRVLVKGSPEAIGSLLEGGKFPAMYNESAHRLAREGFRVLALAYKDVAEGMTTSEAIKIPREEVESELKFAGFVCFECPLRTDSRKVIRMLKAASHMVTMITGDATLTAAHVAAQVGMCAKSVLILDLSEVNIGTVEWFSANSGKRKKKFAVEKIPELAKEFDLCVSGRAFEFLMESDVKACAMLKFIKVYARMSPEQKEKIITSLKEDGLVTLMCGDGTNDVGALKQAHVGVALLSAPSKPRNVAKGPESRVKANSTIKSEGGQKNQRSNNLRQRKKPGHSGDSEGEKGLSKAANSEKEDQKRKGGADTYKKTMEELSASLENMDDQGPLVKLGDASIASPFTSRRMTIDSCASIIRQGRCTLATTLQMYQILALNCLINAYSLSVLYLQGSALGDKQLTTLGLVFSVASFMVNRSKPLKKLSPQRPESSVFTPNLFLSLMGQFAIHVICLILSMRLIQPFIPEGHQPKIDEEFKPSLANTVVFLLTIAQQLSVYVLNYKGRPFMQGLTENKSLMNSLLVSAGLLIICTAEVSSDLNTFLELVPWPSQQLQLQIAGVLLFDFLGSFFVHKFFTILFAPRVRVVD